MSGRVVVLALLAAASLSGCNSAPTDADVADRAESLWSSRVEYVGDSSAVADLVREVGPAPKGSYSISLHTARRPYGLSIELEPLDKPVDSIDFSEPATLMLGLVTDLDTVSVGSSGHVYSLTADSASTSLGYDVKELGRDKGRLTAYLDEHGY